MKKSYIVDSTCNDMRLDRWLRLKIGKIPQGLVEKYLRTGKIKLNRKKVKSSFKVKTKDEINIFNIEFKEIIIQVFQFLINILAGLMITRISAIYLKNYSHWIFLLMMISPFEAVYAGALISEVITSFLLLSSFFSLIVLKGKSKWILSGIFIGLCCLTRDSYLSVSYTHLTLPTKA